MDWWNMLAAWVGFSLGGISGAVIGVGFHRAEWMGGYDGWRRRLVRLGHISFFGIGLLNLSFALTVRTLGEGVGVGVPSVLLLVAAVAMPGVCFLSAWREGWRQLFFVPVLSVVVASVWTAVLVVMGGAGAGGS